MKNLLLVSLVVLATANCYSQNFKFGKISKTELLETYHPLDSLAPAAILNQETKSEFVYEKTEGFRIETYHKKRIKIYSKEGYDWATQIIHLRKSNNESEITRNLKAITYTLENGKIVENKLDKDQIFTEDVNQYWNTNKFTLPNIQPGCIIEFQYSVVSNFIWNIPLTYLQYSIPVNRVMYHFEAPEYYSYKHKVLGLNQPQAQVSHSTKNFTIYYTEENLNMDLNRTKSNSSSYQKEINIIQTDLNLTHLPAIQNEEFVRNIRNYQTGIRMELEYVQFPGEAVSYSSNNWENISTNLMKSTNFGGQIRKSNYYSDDISKITHTLSTPQEKLTSIYYFVKEKMKWNAYISKFTDKGVRSAYKSGTGNSAEINLMLTSMLNHVGIEAYPVILSTVDNGIPNYTSEDAYNYVISCAIIDGKRILLDACGSFNGIDILPFHALNWRGRIIKNAGTSQPFPLTPRTPSLQISSISASINPNGRLTGKSRIQYSDYEALQFRNNYFETDSNTYINSLSNKLGDYDLNSYLLESINYPDAPIIESFQFELSEPINLAANTIIIDPLLFLGLDHNLFSASNRTLPIDLIYPFKHKKIISLDIPEGYTVQTLPESQNIKLPHNMGSYKYLISNSSSTVTLMITISISQEYILPENYKTLQQFYNHILSSEDQQLVLKKKEIGVN